MRRHYENKQMKPSGEELLCVRDCEAPGYGAWKSGEKVRDPKLVERLKGNPNFEVITREDK
jgi:hypothetical protein